MVSGQRILVGGPIQHAISADSHFRAEVRDAIESVIAGLRDAGYVVWSAHEAERFGEVDFEGKSARIVLRDYRWMLHCDAYVCIIPVNPLGEYYRSDGSYIELGWASALGKPILALIGSGRDDVQLSEVLKGLHAICDVCYIDADALASDPACLLDRLGRLLRETPKSPSARGSTAEAAGEELAT